MMSWPLRHLQLSSAKMGDVDMFWAHITTILRNNVKYLIRLLLNSFSSGLVVKHAQLLPSPPTTSEIFKSIERLKSHMCSPTVTKSIWNPPSPRSLSLPEQGTHQRNFTESLATYLAYQVFDYFGDLMEVSC